MVKKTPQRVLVIDVGGSNVKLLATGKTERIKIPSGPKFTPARMTKEVLKATKNWDFDVISIGLPCPISNGTPLKEPCNLGKGWVRYDYQKSFNCPVKIINDATMQALGCYRGTGSMLFLGVGTGLGATLIVDGTPVPLEIAHLPYREKKSYEEYAGKAGLKRLGKKRWQKHLETIVDLFQAAFVVEDVVLGGGNAKLLDPPPKGTREVDNSAAFVGGFRMWE